MDLVTYALCKQYVSNTANSLGAVKGSPCAILSTQDNGDSCSVVFGWTGTDGKQETTTVSIPYGLTDDERVEFENDLKAYINHQLSDVTLLDGINFITDENGNTLWTGVDSIPVPTSADAGKVLGVGQDGKYALIDLSHN